jgi:hypothetical protein
MILHALYGEKLNCLYYGTHTALVFCGLPFKNTLMRSFLFLFLMFPTVSHSQTIAVLKVSFHSTNYVPLSIPLDSITSLASNQIMLFQLKGNKRIEVPYQVEDNNGRILHWFAKTEGADAKEALSFELARGLRKSPREEVELVKKEGGLVVQSGERNLLQYQYGMHFPPVGIDSVFKRSGFIHPLYTPNGKVLTRINAVDHYHHYGIWNPWASIQYQGKHYDLWNLSAKQGTVRFNHFTSTISGPIFGEFEVLHQHVIYIKGGGGKVILNELQKARVYRLHPQNDRYILDLTIKLSCATDSAVTLKAYRYGGLSWRATEKWDDNNSQIITSLGKTKKDADNAKANWVLIQGNLDQDYGGALMMSHPKNYNHPEPLRIWPEKMNTRGDVFANFSPTKNKDWLLQPGNEYVLNYRFFVFNGKLSSEDAAKEWIGYSNPPKITIKVYKKD